MMAARQTMPETRLRFAIDRWHAWAPGANAREDWNTWLNGTLDAPADAAPDVGFLPALLRRRLDRMGRMALATAWPCVEHLDGQVELVFGSRHGSLARLTGLLDAVGHGQPLSPTPFSLSVHNTTVGLLSIARHNHHRATAISAGEDTLAMTLLDGATVVAADRRPVLVTYAEDRPPEVYADLLPTPRAHPFAVSLLLVPAGDGGCTLVADTAPEHVAAEPEMALMGFLLEQTTQARIGIHQGWRLERARG